MTSVIHLLTIVSMVFHALAGCCWHHDHVSQKESATTAEIASNNTVQPAHQQKCSCSHGSPVTSEKTDFAEEHSQQGEDSSSPCQGDKCHYWSSNSNQNLEVMTAWAVGELSCELPETCPTSLVRQAVDWSDGPVSDSSSRRSLLQVWVV